MEIISLDAHKWYSLAQVEDAEGKVIRRARIEHQRGQIQHFLRHCTSGSTVALETIGNWYWIVDEIEAAGMRPALVHARKAKLMMGKVNKTDRLDVLGLNRLQRAGTLPEVWIPPKELRDKRDLSRTRMVLTGMRTKIKNRIHSVFAKYALHDFGEVSDIFCKGNRKMIEERIKELPPETRFTTQCILEELDALQGRIVHIETRMRNVFEEAQEIKLLMTLPGVGFILAVVIAYEMGDVERFPSPGHFAAYAGTTPRVHASGGKVRHGALRPDVNRYLKWAFIEAANAICLNRETHPYWHVSRLYKRIHERKGHPKAIGAIARHLAEAAYCMMKKREPYKDKGVASVSSRKA
jgi:transposase